MNKSFGQIMIAAFFWALWPGMVFGAVSAASCFASELAATMNKPVPDTVLTAGGQVGLDGRIWLPGSAVSSGKCAKLFFYVAPDSDVALADCLGRPAGSCDGVLAECPIRSACEAVLGPGMFTVAENAGNNVIKIGELAIADSMGSINSGDYSVEFSQSFVLPQNLALRGPARIYVQYTGAIADTSGEYRSRWLAAYQKVVIGDGSAARNIPDALGGNAVQSDYCASSSGPAAILYWKWSDPGGGPQAAYQVQIGERSDFSRPIYDSARISSSNTNYATPGGKLVWGKRYYWRVKAWNAAGAESKWSPGIPFDTPLHPYPKVSFVWTPKIPLVGDEVEFIDESEVYGKSAKARWLWSFGEGEPSISYEQGARVKFPDKGIKNVGLSVTDSDGYSCSSSRLLQTDAKP